MWGLSHRPWKQAMRKDFDLGCSSCGSELSPGGGFKFTNLSRLVGRWRSEPTVKGTESRKLALIVTLVAENCNDQALTTGKIQQVGVSPKHITEHSKYLIRPIFLTPKRASTSCDCSLVPLWCEPCLGIQRTPIRRRMACIRPKQKQRGSDRLLSWGSHKK